MRIVAFVSIVILMAGSFCMGADSPEQVVKNFYAKYFETKPDGLPGEQEMKALSPFLSKRLLELFENARKYQEEFSKRNPEEKPPFVEGCLFSSLFEGPTSFEVGRMEKMPVGTYKVSVHFSYVDSTNPANVTRWDDAVIVAVEKERYVIEDILLLGDWSFKVGGKLSDVLRERE